MHQHFLRAAENNLLGDEFAMLSPYVILMIGLVVVVGGIAVLRVHAFLSLLAAALVVSLLAPIEGADMNEKIDWGEKIARVAVAFGTTAGKVGIVIALASIIGAAMTASGAADRVVQMFLRLLGEKRGATALTAGGFTVSIPVFFDTVFFLLLPIVRSMYRRTGGHYLKYLLAVVASATAHALVPPTPGPIAVASDLGVSIGMMMMVGFAIAAPASVAGLAFAAWCDKRMPITPDLELEDEAAAEVSEPKQLPNLAWALAPILLPVLFITVNAIVKTTEVSLPSSVQNLLTVLGDSNVALLVGAVAALATQKIYCRQSLSKLAHTVEHALLSGGVIVLITAAGGAFGAMLQQTNIAEAIKTTFGDSAVSGFPILGLAFMVAVLIKFAQGSTTAAMLVTAGMMKAMIGDADLAFHPVYIATSIGSGALVGSWMNDSGFWIFAKMGHLTEIQTLKTWTPLLALMGIVAMLVNLVLAMVLPMPLG